MKDQGGGGKTSTKKAGGTASVNAGRSRSAGSTSAATTKTTTTKSSLTGGLGVAGAGGANKPGVDRGTLTPEKSKPPKTATEMLAGRSGGTDSFLGTAGSDYRNMMDWAVSRGNFPGQITNQELPYLLSRGTPSTLDKLAGKYVETEWGLILPGSGIGNKLGVTMPGAGGAPLLVPPTLPSSGGGETKYEWSEGKYQLAGGKPPEWWVAMTPDKVDEKSSYAMMMNSMIPYMSPEDQVRAAHSLYMFDPNGFSRYKSGKIPEARTRSEEEQFYRGLMGLGVAGAAPGGGAGRSPNYVGMNEYDLNAEMRKYMTSQQRATDAIQTLSNMREATTKAREPLGPGYTMLQTLLGSFEGAGAKEQSQGVTRRDYSSLLGSLDPTLAATQGGELAGYGGLAQMLSQPYASAGQITPMSQLAGRNIFGQQNQRFF
jgi:hypothetical protein